MFKWNIRLVALTLPLEKKNNFPNLPCSSTTFLLWISTSWIRNSCKSGRESCDISWSPNWGRNNDARWFKPWPFCSSPSWRSPTTIEFGSRFHSPSQKGHENAELPGTCCFYPSNYRNFPALRRNKHSDTCSVPFTAQTDWKTWFLNQLAHVITLGFDRFVLQIVQRLIWMLNQKLGEFYPQNGWFISWKTLLKWMIWGYHYICKHPYNHQWLGFNSHVQLGSQDSETMKTPPS